MWQVNAGAQSILTWNRSISWLKTMETMCQNAVYRFPDGNNLSHKPLAIDQIASTCLASVPRRARVSGRMRSAKSVPARPSRGMNAP